jgi:hypothetical protein
MKKQDAFPRGKAYKRNWGETAKTTALTLTQASFFPAKRQKTVDQTYTVWTMFFLRRNYTVFERTVA